MLVTGLSGADQTRAPLGTSAVLSSSLGPAKPAARCWQMHFSSEAPQSLGRNTRVESTAPRFQGISAAFSINC